MPNRRISVVIPCLNDAELLDLCLSSLREQTIAPDEIVVVDNGSDDHSAEVARRYTDRVITEPRRGITWATAAGFDAASGDALTRIDADTILPRDYIERLHHAWSAAINSAPRRVVGITGNGRFDIPGWRGTLISTVYLEAYRRTAGLALGHHPFFGSNYSVDATWWREIRDTVEFSDTFVHEDFHLSFAVRPDETVWLQKDLTLELNRRSVTGFRQMVTRFQRGFHTVFTNWRNQPPQVRLAQRGLLGPCHGAVR